MLYTLETTSINFLNMTSMTGTGRLVINNHYHHLMSLIAPPSDQNLNLFTIDQKVLCHCEGKNELILF